MIPVIHGLICCILVSGCSGDEAIQIEQRAASLYCQRMTVRQISDSMWNDVSRHLDNDLPKDMVPDVRKRMIEIKNASILRNFKNYHLLADSIKNFINLADEEDSRLVSRLQAINAGIDSLESQKLDYISSLGSITEKSAFEARIRKIIEKPCTAAVAKK